MEIQSWGNILVAVAGVIGSITFIVYIISYLKLNDKNKQDSNNIKK